MNQLFYGDNLDVMRKYIKDETIDLCYIDPPFNSKRNYNQIYNNIGSEDKAQAQAFVDTWTWNDFANEGFDDIMENNIYSRQTKVLIDGLLKVLGKGSLMSYLISMTQRINEIHRVLKPTGSFYFHCDPSASHYIKIVLDSIFCSAKGEYQNEIIWSYNKWAVANNSFSKNNDTIFFYTKTDNYTFNIQYQERAASTLRRFGNKKIVSGFDENTGKRIPATTTDEDSRGVKMSAVWNIPIIAPSANERLGYPTQKPEALLERIIRASSNEGDVILDAFCGCGTSVAVAQKLNRKWIGIDITYQSISLILKRIEDAYGKDAIAKITLSGVPQDMDSAVALANKSDDRIRKEFEKWAVLSYSDNRAMINEKKGGDGGVDGEALVMEYSEEKGREYRSVIFSVKSNKTLSPSVIRDLNGTLERDRAAAGVFITLYPMPNLIKEAAKYGMYENSFLKLKFPKIQVVSVEEILEGKRMNLPATQAIEVTKKAKLETKSEKSLFEQDEDI